MSDAQIVIFTDGASKGNPGPGGWGAIILTPAGRVTELGGGDPSTTNNKMELTGAIEALARLQETPGRVAVYTDSTYVIKGIREWVHGWKRRGWKTAGGTDVMNRNLWERLDRLTAARGPRAITWHYVRGHVGIPGNERVDQIADAFAVRQAVTLYDGPLLGYPVPLMDLPDDTTVPARTSSSDRTSKAPRLRSGQAPAYSYLSVVDGKPMRHATWAECERRVKGRSGARFRKATSPADQEAILRSWSFSLNDL
jgi:ribonuclease HI